MNKPYLSALPSDSKISSQLNNAYFHDSWSIVLGQPDLNVFQQLIKLFQHTPAWIEWSMNMRNKITSKIGLKDLGSFKQIDTNKKKMSMSQVTELEFSPYDNVPKMS